MLKSYLKSALRNLKQFKVQTIIHVFGLSIGLAFFILAFLYLWNEKNYDRFHYNRHEIFRIYRTEQRSSRTFKNADSELPLATALEHEIEDIKAVRYEYSPDVEFIVKAKERIFFEPLAFTDAAFFDVFTFPVLFGDASYSLVKQHNIVLTDRMAQKLFGSKNSIGERIFIRERWNDTFHEYIVSAVVKSSPSYSSLQFDILLPIQNVELYSSRSLNEWYGGNTATFIKTSQPPQHLEPQLRTIVDKYMTAPWYTRSKITLHLQPLDKMYSEPEIRSQFPTENPTYQYILLGIALAILVIASINFINMTLARSVTRSLEVGVRKTLGAAPRHVTGQFFVEFALLFIFSFIIGLLLCEVFISFFNQFMDTQLSLNLLLNLTSLPFLLISLFFICLLAGTYPVLHMSRMLVNHNFTSSYKSNHKNVFGRGLVIFQFAAAVTLICCTIVMLKQLDYIKHKDLGYQSDHVLVVSTKHLIQQNYQFLSRFKNKLLARHDILKISSMSKFTNHNMLGGRAQTKSGEKLEFLGYYIDEHFLDILNIPLIAGRNFRSEKTSDPTSAVIINQAMAQALEIKHPVNEIVYFSSPNAKRNPETNEFYEIVNPRIVGVVSDYHFHPLHQEIEPLALFYNPAPTGNEIFIKIKGDNIKETLAFIKSQWREFTPDMPFTFTFLDDALEQQYRQEILWSRFITYVSFITIAIACLGMFGLVSITLVSRTQEISIRKVLGATVKDILSLFNREQFILLIIANVFAWPIAWYAMNKWLQNFAYHINMSWWIFIVASAAALVIAITTLSTLVLKAATANPVDALRYE